jgi:hypothetical protein
MDLSLAGADLQSVPNYSAYYLAGADLQSVPYSTHYIHRFPINKCRHIIHCHIHQS